MDGVAMGAKSGGEGVGSAVGCVVGATVGSNMGVGVGTAEIAAVGNGKGAAPGNRCVGARDGDGVAKGDGPEVGIEFGN